MIVSFCDYQMAHFYVYAVGDIADVLGCTELTTGIGSGSDMVLLQSRPTIIEANADLCSRHQDRLDASVTKGYLLFVAHDVEE